MQYTLYTPESFQHKRPIPAIEFTSIHPQLAITTTSESNPLTFQYDRHTHSGAMEHTYASLRISEFKNNCSTILHNRLQAGFAKSGRVHVPGCDFRLLQCLFSSYECKQVTRRRTVRRDNEKVRIERRHYIFKKMPDFGTHYFIREYTLEDENRTPVRSFYTELVFVVCHDSNRVWILFKQTTQQKRCGRWIKTC